MNKKRVAKDIILIILGVISLGLVIYFEFFKEETKTVIEDNIKFKEEYESYNDEYVELNIDEDNKIEYLNYKEFKNKFVNDTSMILVGSSKSNSSRLFVDVLLLLKNNYSVSKIYYLDYNNLSITNEKDYLTLVDKEEIVIPSMLFIKNGVIKDIVEFEKSSDIIELTEEEKTSLYKELETNYVSIFDISCDEEC